MLKQVEAEEFLLTNTKISIFIPVYRESTLLECLLDKVLNDPYKNKEIFVIIDEPTEKSMNLCKKFKGSVNFILNGKRKGKANVLNEMAEGSSGEILLFLDSDITIPQNQDHFLETLLEEAKDADIVEIKKKIIRDSFLAKIVDYDYLSFNCTNWIFSHVLGRCLGLNGAAFAVKRKVFEALGGFRRVISEDLDLGIRSFISNCKFKYVDKIEVCIKVSPSWRQWFDQRKRWGIGTAFWLKENYRELIENIKKYPRVLLPSLLLILPSLPLFMINMLIPNEIYFKLLSLSLIIIATRGGSILFPPLLMTSSIVAIKNLVTTISSFGVYSFIFYFIARKLDFAFEPLGFAFFYFVYSPLWFFILLVSIIKVFTNENAKFNINWKV